MNSTNVMLPINPQLPSTSGMLPCIRRISPITKQRRFRIESSFYFQPFLLTIEYRMLPSTQSLVTEWLPSDCASRESKLESTPTNFQSRSVWFCVRLSDVPCNHGSSSQRSDGSSTIDKSEDCCVRSNTLPKVRRVLLVGPEE